MKSLILAAVLVAGAMGMANAQTPSISAVKACIARVSAAQPLSLGQNIAAGGWFFVDACLNGRV